MEFADLDAGEFPFFPISEDHGQSLDLSSVFDINEYTEKAPSNLLGNTFDMNVSSPALSAPEPSSYQSSEAVSSTSPSSRTSGQKYSPGIFEVSPPPLNSSVAESSLGVKIQPAIQPTAATASSFAPTTAQTQQFAGSSSYASDLPQSSHFDRQREEYTSVKFQCPLPDCDEQFLQKQDLDVHTRIHASGTVLSGSKENSDQRFSQTSTLNVPVRPQKPEKIQVCDLCGAEFKSAGAFRNHRAGHEQKKPFACRFGNCTKAFTQAGNLKSHQIKIHGDIVRQLTQRFEHYSEDRLVELPPNQRDLFLYFTGIHRRSRGPKPRNRDAYLGYRDTYSNTAGGLPTQATGMSSMGVTNSMTTASRSGDANDVPQYDLATVVAGVDLMSEFEYGLKEYYAEPAGASRVGEPTCHSEPNLAMSASMRCSGTGRVFEPSLVGVVNNDVGGLMIPQEQLNGLRHTNARYIMPSPSGVTNPEFDYFESGAF
ncbi:hypothetical protein CANCADRAFT_104868 [Tortispora caseinolytica NRRL Y-17796]|uniref:C2H2-type domain-containing protein n=1 Tax=Tortispora caseinolytica NRRL Y-17796 TaxID=767744 RepID=A0A1E4TF49_9ASCO|nr:hypothetical protein CANCADRAFT_104868 [Tortispora caseinolytica NRRL Y-17796]